MKHGWYHIVKLKVKLLLVAETIDTAYIVRLSVSRLRKLRKKLVAKFNTIASG